MRLDNYACTRLPKVRNVVFRKLIVYDRSHTLTFVMRAYAPPRRSSEEDELSPDTVSLMGFNLVYLLDFSPSLQTI